MEPRKSTIVRIRNLALRGYFRYVGKVAPRRVGKTARDLWFTAPARMEALAVPDGGAPFQLEVHGHAVRGRVWGAAAAPTVYLVHGWGGRGAQLAAMVSPLVETGHQVVMVDLPAHGDSDHGPAGPRRTHGVEFAKALDAVFCRFGPAEAVIAHSMGTITTYLAMRYGWLGAARLVLIAPMVEAQSLVDRFQRRPAGALRQRGRLGGDDRCAARHDARPRTPHDPARPRRDRAGGHLRRRRGGVGPDGVGAPAGGGGGLRISQPCASASRG
jgi:pimeloyl-ACP methyl ester carboxylesterase